MPDKIEITVKVNGESVPLSTLSDETIKKIKKQEIEVMEENAPVFSMIRDRLIVKLNSKVLRTMRRILAQINSESSPVKEGTFMSFEPGGIVGVYDLGNTWKKASSFYSDHIPKTLFPND